MKIYQLVYHRWSLPGWKVATSFCECVCTELPVEQHEGMSGWLLHCIILVGHLPVLVCSEVVPSLWSVKRVSKDTGSPWEFVLKRRMTCPHGSFHRATPVSVNQKPDICEVSGKIQLTRLSARVVQKWCVKAETNETIGLKPLPTSLPFSIHRSSPLSFVSAFPFSFSFCLLLYIWESIKGVHAHANAEIDENAF